MQHYSLGYCEGPLRAGRALSSVARTTGQSHENLRHDSNVSAGSGWNTGIIDPWKEQTIRIHRDDERR